MNGKQRHEWRVAVISSSLTATEKLVVLALETFADYKTGADARPGYDRLAAMCGCKSRAVESAMAEAKRLGFIEQTSKAQPKAGLAAVFRIVSTRTDARVQEDSTRADVRVQEDSTRADVRAEDDFYPREMDFNPHETPGSTRTHARTTSPHPTTNTSGEKKPPTRTSSSSKKKRAANQPTPVTPGSPPPSALGDNLQPIAGRGWTEIRDAVVGILLRAQCPLTVDEIERAVRNHPDEKIRARSSKTYAGIQHAVSDGLAAKSSKGVTSPLNGASLGFEYTATDKAKAAS